MTTATATHRAVRWTCADCQVSVGRLDGTAASLPPNWSQVDEDELLCLGCSRARAGAEAVDAAPDSTSREDRVRLQRAALIEFEIRRSPEATDGAIARSCRTSSAVVAGVRGAAGLGVA